MKKYILIISLIILAGCTNVETETTAVEDTTVTESSLSDETESEKPKGLTFNTKTIEDEDADESIFSDYDITMVNVWATYCGPCIVEMPILEETYQELLGMNCNLIGIVSDTVLGNDDSFYAKNLDAANEIVTDNGVTFISLQTDLDLYKYMAEKLKIKAVPTTFFLDSDGNRVGPMVIGAKSKERYIKYVEDALEKIGDKHEEN